MGLRQGSRLRFMANRLLSLALIESIVAKKVLSMTQGTPHHRTALRAYPNNSSVASHRSFAEKHAKSAKACRDKSTRILRVFTGDRVAQQESGYWDRLLVPGAINALFLCRLGPAYVGSHNNKCSRDGNNTNKTKEETKKSFCKKTHAMLITSLSL
jgi:hypothetical protein